MSYPQTDIMSSNNGQARLPSLAPAVDIFENEEEYLYLVDIPGVKEGNLNVEIVGRP